MKEIKKFSITQNFKWFGLIALLVAAAGLIGIICAPFGLNLFNLDIDFTGGTTMYIEMHAQYDDAIRDRVTAIVKDETDKEVSSIQKTGEGTQIIVKTKELTTEERAKIFDALKAEYNLEDNDLLQTDNVTASVGNDLKTKAFLASLVAAIAMLIYITFRFELCSGLAAVVCLIHDLLVMMSVYVIFRVPMNMNFIAAVLTILGYSINASIIVFDRVRENMKYAKKEGFAEIVDRSIWQTMPRTINTSLTTLFVILMILILGVPSLQNFALPIVVGIVAGAYSSTFLAGSLWNAFKKKFKKA